MAGQQRRTRSFMGTVTVGGLLIAASGALAAAPHDSQQKGHLYALVQICGVEGRGHCDEAVFAMPVELTKAGCTAMGAVYRGRIIGADETGEAGRVDTWECFTSRLPVKNAKPLLGD